MTTAHKFIRAFDGPWHIALTKKSEDQSRSYIVTACSNKQIGGPWGHQTWKHEGNPRPVCKNCQKQLDKEWQAKCDDFFAFKRASR